jgi:ubiquinone/menaquinone biosynthesis C-methylase UbiE
MLPFETRSILDVGCGDGSIAAEVREMDRQLEVWGLEVKARAMTKIRVATFDGVRIPESDRSVDVVLLIDVLHHTLDPAVLMAEANRVARRGILIKDHVQESRWDRTCLGFMDWVGNRHHDVGLMYKYWSAKSWLRAWNGLGLNVEQRRTRLGLYPSWARWLFERNLHFMAFLSSSPGGRV